MSQSGHGRRNPYQCLSCLRWMDLGGSARSADGRCINPACRAYVPRRDRGSAKQREAVIEHYYRMWANVGTTR